MTKANDELTFDFAGSSPSCAGPLNSVLATTLSSVYLAMRHIFPKVPISAGAFEPLKVLTPEGTFLDAHYPRPVSGCAAEVSQRIAEAGTSGNFALGGHHPERNRDFVMYQLSGGGYGGNDDHDGLSNGCSTIGISKAPPAPIAAVSASTTSWSSGAVTPAPASSWITATSARKARSAAPTTRPTRSWCGAMASRTRRSTCRRNRTFRCRRATECGCARRAAAAPARDPDAVLEDVRLGRYSANQARELFGVAIAGEPPAVDKIETESLRGGNL